jgi:DNA-directed RNA polymerase specialized sigma24 family protein
MLVNDFRTVTKLRRIVDGMGCDASEREDLLQEALIHLWMTQSRRPEQTVSWYLQSCRFHLQHYLARGRSVDSKKRCGNRSVLFAADDPFASDEQAIADFYYHEVQTSVDDDIRALSARLPSADQKMLEYLLNGLTLREAAAHLGISFPTALKRRRRMAELFKKLDRPPFLKVCLSKSVNGSHIVLRPSAGLGRPLR